MKMTFALLLCVSFYLNGFSQCKQISTEQLVSDVQAAIQKSVKSSVKIVACDTRAQKSNAEAFEGMVINPEGYILAKAHAVNPGQQYLIYFSNGMVCTAKGLGSIVSPEHALLKITGNVGEGLEPGKVVG